MLQNLNLAPNNLKLKILIASFIFCLFLLIGFTLKVFAQTCNNNGSCDVLETCLTCSSDCGSCPLPISSPTQTPTPTSVITSNPQPTAQPTQASSTNPVVNQTINVQSPPTTTSVPSQSTNSNGKEGAASVEKKQIEINEENYPSRRVLLPDEDVELVFTKDSFSNNKNGWVIVFPSLDTNVTFNFNALLVGGDGAKEVSVPEKITLEKPVGESNLTIIFPQNLIIGALHLSQGLNWDGKFNGPKILAASESCASSQDVKTVVDIGLPDSQVTFSKNVEITFPGEYNSAAGYCFDKQFKEISVVCSKTLTNECYLQKNKDLVIRTNHFTQFMTYKKPIPVMILALASLGALALVVIVAVYLFIRLKISEKISSDYISKTAHELKTPMSAIKGYLSMILRGDFGPVKKDLKEPLENMSDSTENLLTLTNDVLDVSRIKSNKLKLTHSTFSIGKLIDEVVEELIPLAKEKNIELKNVSKKVKTSVYADESRVKEILINLVGNAIKFTQKGGVEISTETEKKNVKVYVSDTGVGISKDSQEKLFKKFEELGKKSENPTGTGLGLYISKEIAKKMGGDLRLKKSEEGVGSVFAFSVPTSERP